MADEQVNTCVESGHCEMHGVEIERRRQDRSRIDALEAKWREHEAGMDIKFGNLWSHMSKNSNMIYGIFVSLGLIMVIVLGSYYYTNTVNTANDRGEEILLNKIYKIEETYKIQQSEIMTTIVTLLTSDAEQKEWQRGVIRQLELINHNMEKATNGGPTHGVPRYYDDNDYHYVLPPTGAEGINYIDPEPIHFSAED